MSDSFSSVSLRFADEFEIQLYRLSKKYRNIRSDIEPILKQLQSGNFLGYGKSEQEDITVNHINSIIDSLSKE